MRESERGFAPLHRDKNGLLERDVSEMKRRHEGRPRLVPLLLLRLPRSQQKAIPAGLAKSSRGRALDAGTNQGRGVPTVRRQQRFQARRVL
jgi:hypothetical protein